MDYPDYPDSHGPFRPGLPLDGAVAAGPQDAGLQDAGPHDVGLHDVGPHDVGPQDAGLHDVGPQDAGLADGDVEWAQYVAWADREVAAGRGPAPEPWAFGDDEPWDTEPGDPELAGSAPSASGRVRLVPAGPTRPLFAEDGEADVMPPRPMLAALTEMAAGDVAALSDSELVGVLRASRRQVAREHYKQALAAAEFGRRRHAAFNDALARGIPAGCAAGGFPGEELAIELTVSRAEAGHLIDDGIDLTTRLPRTLAGMAAGLIDAVKAGWVAYYTRSMSPADAARADDILAAEAPDLQAEQLTRKAAALEKKLNPEGARARRERGKRDDQRVEARPERSGNASLAGRELDVADVLASMAYLDAVAARLRKGGLPGSLDRLRALAMTDLTQGRDPLDRINPAPAPARPGHDQPPAPPPAPPSGPSPAGPSPADPSQSGPSPAPSSGPSPSGPSSGPSPSGPSSSSPAPEDTEAVGEDDAVPPPRPGGPAPVPALINLIVPAATLVGASTTPAQAGAFGLLDADDTRALATAATAHPATRWCLTLTGPDGTALFHGCARGPRPRLLDDLGPQAPPAQLAELLRRLNITLTPIARGSCDHATAEEGYVPSRKLRHLVRARTATCDAPGCRNPASTTDLDHTVAWPAGPTDQCNLAPRCRTHHRAKQAPDWTVEQIGPGVTRWTLPSGRSHLTTPTQYDA